VLTTVETKSFSGNIWPQLKASFPDQEPIERSFMNSWDDKNFVAAIEKTGRKKIVLCGLWTETCVALPTIQAIHDGYEIYVAEDCCGDISQLAHDNAMRRVVQAGAKPVTSLSTLLEWQRDWANRNTCGEDRQVFPRASLARRGRLSLGPSWVMTDRDH
jgi:isochorismate hydrolase